MKNVLFCDMALVKTEISRELITSIITVERIDDLTFLRSLRELLITVNIVSSSLILFTTMMEVIRSFETSVLTRATWHYIPEDGNLHQNF
jgi:hypothetical protein